MFTVQKTLLVVRAVQVLLNYCQETLFVMRRYIYIYIYIYIYYRHLQTQFGTLYLSDTSCTVRYILTCWRSCNCRMKEYTVVPRFIILQSLIQRFTSRVLQTIVRVSARNFGIKK